MAEWLGRASKGHEMYRNLKVMGSNPSRVEHRVLSTSV